MGNKQQVGVVEHPEKIPVGLFLSKPLKKLGRVITNWCRRIFGYWYCGHCERYHSARVVRYDVSGGIGDDVCSLGKGNLTLFGSLKQTLQDVGDGLLKAFNTPVENPALERSANLEFTEGGWVTVIDEEHDVYVECVVDVVVPEASGVTLRLRKRTDYDEYCRAMDEGRYYPDPRD